MDTKYELIANEWISRIKSGQIKEKDKFPSIRELAQYYQCNKSTVIQAFRLLETKHYCYCIPKSGYYVLSVKESNNIEENSYDFIKALPLQDYLPYREFNHSMNKAIEKYADRLFQYGHINGLKSTRETLSKFFLTQDIYTDSDHIMITSGANQGLDIIFRAMNLGTRVLVEQPTYDMVIDIARMCGIELLGIPRSESGLNLHLLESAFQTCDFFYTIPRLSNPSGYSYTEAQKKKIAELACKYHVMIIEDDYLGDMIPAGRDFPIYYYGMGEYNIYIKSFSKGFLPGIRLGAVVFSNNKKYESFWQKCIEVKKLTDYGTSIYSQGALETFIHSGMYQRHLNKIQAAYPERMNKIRRFLDNKKSEKISWYIPNNGIFITMTIKCNKSSGWVDRQLKLHGINAKALSVFFLSEISDKTNITFRLCVTALPLDKVYEGLSRINQIFD